jgi:hypothetical protein
LLQRRQNHDGGASKTPFDIRKPNILGIKKEVGKNAKLRIREYE